jgi:hypothetical protein
MEKRIIKASDVLSMIQDRGMTRPEIKKELGLTGREMKELFSHPTLKYKRAVKKETVSFVFEDDVDSTEETVELLTEEQVDAFSTNDTEEETEEENNEIESVFSNPV